MILEEPELGGDYKEIVPCVQLDICTYELTVAVTTCVRPAQAQARQNLGIETGGGHKAPSLRQRMIVTDSCQESES